MRVVVSSLCIAFAAIACNGRDLPRSPTQSTTLPLPAPPAAGGNIDLANWRGDALVLSRTGSGGCGWGTTAGEQRSGVLWRVAITDGSILLDQDMSNWPTDHIPFSGSLSGEQFTARYSQGADYARWVCQFREAHLSGRFSPDFSSFEALETLVWGVPGNETVVERRWVASRR